MARQDVRPHRLDDTIDLLAAAQNLNPAPNNHTACAEHAKNTIADCDAKLATHRAALEAGADPAVITQWITQTQATRARAEAELRAARTARTGELTRDDIAALARSHCNLVTVLAAAEPADRVELYRQLGLILTYDSGKQKVPWAYGRCPRPDTDREPTTVGGVGGVGSGCSPMIAGLPAVIEVQLT